MKGNLGGHGGRLGFVLVEFWLKRSLRRRRRRKIDAKSKKGPKLSCSSH